MYLNLDITAYPNLQQLKKQPQVDSSIPPKLLAILKKYKYNWRLDQLSRQVSFKTARKYIYEPVKLIQATPKKQVTIPKSIIYRSDHISRPILRYLVVTKKAHRRLGHRFISKMNRHIKKSWRSEYNYYKNIQRIRERKMNRNRARVDSKVLQKRLEKLKQSTERLSVPKPRTAPEPLPERKRMPLDSLKDRMETLATPKAHRSLPNINPFKVKPAALTYTITDSILKLTKMPERLLIKLPEIIPGRVKKSALRAQASERVQALAIPRKHRENATTTDESDDPWKISANALKYKPTPRILELAKPIERE